jgi:prepilin-type processing-associated H-X9-DG protein
VVSAQGRILPYIEQDNLGKLVDVTMVPLYNSNPATYPLTPGNYVASITPVKLFVCPSDPMGGRNPNAAAIRPDGTPSPTDRYAGLNYVTCIGSGDGSADNTGTWWGQYKTSDGMFGQTPINIAGVSDGLSNTVAFSESTMGTGLPDATGATPADAARQVLTLPGSTVTSDANCAAGAAGSGVWSGMRGAKWINGHYADANYNHHLVPNDKRWDCSNGSHNPGQAAARSYHSGGVNVLLGDGSVHFVRDSIDPATWRALATRNGGEVVGDF